MSDNKEKLQDALGMLDDDLLLEVEKLRRMPQKRRSFQWHRLGAIAACLCVLVGSVFAGRWIKQGSRPESADYLTADGLETATEGAAEKKTENTTEDAIEEETPTEEAEYIEVDNLERSEGEKSNTAAGAALPEAVGVTIEPLMVNLCDDPDVAADMVSLFIYQGRCYVEYTVLEGASQLVGEHLGTVTGLIDEWTQEDGYVDFAGTTSGDIYAVNGFDTDFVLCQIGMNESVVIYMNDNDITLYTGADLLEKRFKIDGSFKAKSISQPRWTSSGVPYPLDEEATEQVYALVEVMLDSPFVYTEDAGLHGSALYHLFLYLDNGMTINLRMYNGGFIMVDGMESVCIQVDPEVFSETIQCLRAVEDSMCGIPVMEGE